MSPADSVFGPLLRWQTVVLEVDAGAAALGGERDLDGAGAGRQVTGAGVAPADQQPVRRVEVQEAAADRCTLDVEVDRLPGSASSRAYSPIQVTITSGRVKYS